MYVRLVDQCACAVSGALLSLAAQVPPAHLSTCSTSPPDWPWLLLTWPLLQLLQVQGQARPLQVGVPEEAGGAGPAGGAGQHAGRSAAAGAGQRAAAAAVWPGAAAGRPEGAAGSGSTAGRQRRGGRGAGESSGWGQAQPGQGARLRTSQGAWWGWDCSAVHWPRFALGMPAVLTAVQTVVYADVLG